MNMGHSFFRKFEATSSLMRGNLGTRRKTNRDNFAPRANVWLGMASRPREKCRRRNELREWCEAQRPEAAHENSPRHETKRRGAVARDRISPRFSVAATATVT
jgi:hypothetical protein